MSSNITIVMYHYIREFSKSRYPRIKGLEFQGFQRQLDYLTAHYEIISAEHLIAAMRKETDLPKNAALLTFDDGYTEHYELAFRELSERKLPGLFFPPVEPVRDRKLLDVNRVHFVLAAAENYDELEAALDDLVRQHASEFAIDDLDTLKAQWAVPNRFDTGQVIYIKRMLQTVLPEALRNIVAAELFSRYVTRDEVGFAEELYISENDAREMSANGMYFGSHGVSHYWLNRIPRAMKEIEIDGSLEFLRSIGSNVDDFWIMCYPFGGWDQELLDVMASRRCAAGLTTIPAIADIGKDNPYLLPRFDTNDFPQ